MMWKELEIDKTKDKDTIRKAYLAKLQVFKVLLESRFLGGLFL